MEAKHKCHYKSNVDDDGNTDNDGSTRKVHTILGRECVTLSVILKYYVVSMLYLCCLLHYCCTEKGDASGEVNPNDVMMALGDIIREYYKRGS